MSRGVNLHTGAEQHIGPDVHLRTVEHDAAEVHVEIVACGDIPAVVAEERRLDFHPAIEAAEQFREKRPPLLRLIGSSGVVHSQLPPRPQARRHQLRLMGDVKLPGQHPLPLARHSRFFILSSLDRSDYED